MPAGNRARPAPIPISFSEPADEISMTSFIGVLVRPAQNSSHTAVMECHAMWPDLVDRSQRHGAFCRLQ
jgi:hypothetical protein